MVPEVVRIKHALARDAAAAAAAAAVAAGGGAAPIGETSAAAAAAALLSAHCPSGPGEAEAHEGDEVSLFEDLGRLLADVKAYARRGRKEVFAMLNQLCCSAGKVRWPAGMGVWVGGQVGGWAGGWGGGWEAGRLGGWVGGCLSSWVASFFISTPAQPMKCDPSSLPHLSI